MNNAPFGTLANLFMRNPMQGGQQPRMQMQQRPQPLVPGPEGQMIGQVFGMWQPRQQQRPQGGSAMNAIIAQLMNRR